MTNFLELGLSEQLLKVLPELNILEPTQIQQKSIPILIKQKEKDFLGLAQTGTGKTAAFGLPLLMAVDPNQKQTQALVLAPTRELGQQIALQIQAFSKYLKGLRVQVVYGGASIVPQMKALKNTPHIIIATPGRLLDLIKRKAVNLSGIKHVVFDEADEMLNMGFREDIDHILSFTEGQKSTWLFSATMAPEIKSIVKKYMDSPNEVKIDTANVVNQNISHKYFVAKSKDKIEVIKRIIELEPDMRGIVFCRTKRETQQLSDILQSKGLPVDAIHGDLSQNQRDQVMKRFKSHSLELLVATDVAARGIDVNDLSHVIHYSMPDDLEYYTHRSGRTGRAGKTGISLALVNTSEQRKIKHIEKKLNIKFEAYTLPKAEHVVNKKLVQWASDLIATEVKPDLIAEHVNDIYSALQGLSKEDIVNKLMTKQLETLDIKSNASFDTTATSFDHEVSFNDKNDRFFINLGLIDGVNEKELIEFISEATGIIKKHFGKISIDDKKSIFELDKDYSHLIAPAFDDMYVDNRKLRVNKETGRKPRDHKGRGRSGGRNKKRISKHGKSHSRRR